MFPRKWSRVSGAGKRGGTWLRGSPDPRFPDEGGQEGRNQLLNRAELRAVRAERSGSGGAAMGMLSLPGFLSCGKKKVRRMGMG